MSDEQVEMDSASEKADFRAATSSLWLADFECTHGQIGDCADCGQNPGGTK